LSLTTQNLVKGYGKRPVVKGVSLTVEQGEIVGLLGPNGAGKTTTFHTIVGFLKPDGGRILIDDGDITHLSMYRRAQKGIGYLPQETSIFRGMTVEQNIAAILEVHGVGKAYRNARVGQLLEELRLQERAKQRADTLSGGEVRRVEIARALAVDVRYLLLDEPFTGIDPRTAEDIQGIISQLTEKGLGVLITDHSVRETLRITSRAYIMADGEILTEGTARELTEDDTVRRKYLGDSFRLD
jgi:lipopolysaccharide export system ATP-binding protein